MHATARLAAGAAVDELDRRLLRHAATELLIALAAKPTATSPAPARSERVPATSRS
jgi:hypothetical protein